MIKEISYEECFLFWQLLWPNRKTPITPVSYMKFPNQSIRETGQFKYEYANSTEIEPPTFLGYIVNSKIVGVNSFHKIAGTTRSRGLFVIEEYRNQGIGSHILEETIKKSTGFVWSYPKKDALKTYIKAGFFICSAPIYDSVENKVNFYVCNKNEV